MPLLWCFVYLIVLLSTGLSATAMILSKRRRSVFEIIALVILLGAGILGTLLFWISLLGFRPDRSVVIVIGLLSIVCNIAIAWFGRLPNIQWPRFDKPAWQNVAIILPILLLIGANLICLIIALGFDTFEWDAWVMWGFKAKVFHAAALSPRPAFFSDVTFSFTHLDYPPLLSMLIAGAYGAMDQINEPLGKCVLPLLYIAQTLLAYLAARRWVGRLSALLLTVVLICAPLNIEHSGIGNADTVLTTFYLGSIFYLMRWFDSRDISDLILTALFCVFLATTKSEGLPIALINTAVLFTLVATAHQQRLWKQFIAFMLIFAVGAGIWWVWRSAIPHTHDDYTSRATWSIFISNFGRIGTICLEIGMTFINVSQWGFLWLLLPLMAILGYRGFARPQAWILWSLVLSQLALYIFVYIITDWDVKELLDVTSGRLMLHIAPAALWLIALHWSATSPILPETE